MKEHFCKNHPDAPAQWQCELCNNYFCNECVKTQQIDNKNVSLCKLCSGRCVSLIHHQPPLEKEHACDEVKIRSAEESFLNQLPSVFAYPFREGAAARLITGMVFFAVLNLIASLSLLGFFLAFFIAGYLFAWFISIIHTTVNGENSLAEWPALSDYWSDIIHPFLLIIGTSLICQLPAALCFISIFFVPSQLRPLLAGAALVLSIMGGIYFPMGLLAVVIFGTIKALNPTLIMPAITKVLGEYVVVCFLLAALVGINLLGNFLGQLIPFLGSFVAYAISFYLMVIHARTLGLLYRSNRDNLGWLEVDEGE